MQMSVSEQCSGISLLSVVAYHTLSDLTFMTTSSEGSGACWRQRVDVVSDERVTARTMRQRSLYKQEDAAIF